VNVIQIIGGVKNLKVRAAALKTKVKTMFQRPHTEVQKVLAGDARLEPPPRGQDRKTKYQPTPEMQNMIQNWRRSVEEHEPRPIRTR